MASERSQRRIERLLDQIDEAESSGTWELVSTLAQDILDVDADNQEASAYLNAARRRLADTSTSTSTPPRASGNPVKSHLPAKSRSIRGRGYRLRR